MTVTLRVSHSAYMIYLQYVLVNVMQPRDYTLKTTTAKPATVTRVMAEFITHRRLHHEDRTDFVTEIEVNEMAFNRELAKLVAGEPNVLTTYAIYGITIEWGEK